VFGFELQAVCPETGARAGILHTAHGDVETPVFMPVGTQAAVKGVLARDLMGDLDAKIILGNTYHLFLRPGHETIRKLGGLHKFMSWPRAILRVHAAIDHRRATGAGQRPAGLSWSEEVTAFGRAKLTRRPR
jgi:hypothetical protein